MSFAIYDKKKTGITCENCGAKADIMLVVEPKRNVYCQPTSIALCEDCKLELLTKLQSEFWNNDNLI